MTAPRRIQFQESREKSLMGRVGNRGEGDMESASAGKGFDWKSYLTLNFSSYNL